MKYGIAKYVNNEFSKWIQTIEYDYDSATYGREDANITVIFALTEDSKQAAHYPTAHDATNAIKRFQNGPPHVTGDYRVEAIE